MEPKPNNDPEKASNEDITIILPCNNRENQSKTVYLPKISEILAELTIKSLTSEVKINSEAAILKKTTMS